ncbi:MAG: DUF2256 domain-containing protein [Pseudomonadota bacterium]
MPRGVKKQNLPEKICAACGLPFTWRRKWARDWDAVKYCSNRCRSKKTPADLSGKFETDSKHL